MRAMFVEFPEDRTTHYLDRQFMLGKCYARDVGPD